MLISPDIIAHAIATSPVWAQIALTAPREGLREDARREVARHVYTTLYQPLSTDTQQLALPL